MFVTAHQSVETTSAKMYAQLKRRTYVTPTNYLETVRERALARKRHLHADRPAAQCADDTRAAARA